MQNGRFESGFTLIEILVVVAISGMLLLSLGNVVGNVSNTQQNVEQRIELEREAAFVMRRLVQVISRSSSVTEIINNASVIEFSFNLDPQRDMDKNGIADADDDGDGLVDEDLPGDTNGNGSQDDDGDGSTNEDGENLLYIEWISGALYQRENLAFDISGNGVVNAADKINVVLADRVSSFSLVVVPQTGRFTIIQVGFELTAEDGVTTTSLKTSVRLGGRL